MEQIRDNMRDVEPLDEAHKKVLKEAAAVINRATAIACTGCGYCVKNCPQKLPVSDYLKEVSSAFD